MTPPFLQLKDSSEIQPTRSCDRVIARRSRRGGSKAGPFKPAGARQTEAGLTRTGTLADISHDPNPLFCLTATV